MRLESNETKILLSNLEVLHSNIEKHHISETKTDDLSHLWLGKSSIEERLKRLRTNYHAVQKSTNALTVKW